MAARAAVWLLLSTTAAASESCSANSAATGVCREVLSESAESIGVELLQVGQRAKAASAQESELKSVAPHRDAAPAPVLSQGAASKAWGGYPRRPGYEAHLLSQEQLRLLQRAGEALLSTKAEVGRADSDTQALSKHPVRPGSEAHRLSREQLQLFQRVGEPSLLSKKASQLPDLGKIADQVTDQVNKVSDQVSKVTEQVSKVTDEVTDKVSEVTGKVADNIGDIPGLEKAKGTLAEAATSSLVKTLNTSLAAMTLQADELQDSVDSARSVAYRRVKKAEATKQAKVEALGKQMNGTLASVLYQWHGLTSRYNTTAEIVVAALEMGGQKDVAEEVYTGMGSVLGEANSLISTFAKVPLILGNATALNDTEISEKLMVLNKTLEGGRAKASKIGADLDEAFGKMLDTAADKLAATAGVDSGTLRKTFEPLETTEEYISQKLQYSSETAITSIGEMAEVALQSASVRASAVLAFGIVGAAMGLSL